MGSLPDFAEGPNLATSQKSRRTRITNVLLMRGDYAYLRVGNGWSGCSRAYEFPEQLSVDYGDPLVRAEETALNSGVFVRRFTKSTVQMDCNTYTPTITMQ